MFAWSLDQKGYHAIRDLLPVLREDGYKSEHVGHDLLVTATHLGEWLLGTPFGVEIFTEQQLRRYDHESYPSWVPNDETHRPDGYWNVPDGAIKKTIALEVELSRQSHARYEATGDFYARNKSIIRVLWIVKNLAAAENINRHLCKAIAGGNTFHAFVLAHNFQSLGWGAPIVNGIETGSSIHSLLQNSTRTCSESVLARLNLDTRKSPHKSKSCSTFSAIDFCI
ncbi:MAG: hypothetical protein NTV34_14995 [Proteobacteria bacterium]|nr:hypothetical protein [Pseudomonadota bacterium]